MIKLSWQLARLQPCWYRRYLLQRRQQFWCSRILPSQHPMSSWRPSSLSLIHFRDQQWGLRDRVQFRMRDHWGFHHRRIGNMVDQLQFQLRLVRFGVPTRVRHYHQHQHPCSQLQRQLREKVNIGMFRLEQCMDTHLQSQVGLIQCNRRHCPWNHLRNHFLHMIRSSQLVVALIER